MANGSITLDGRPATAELARESIKRLAEQKGVVWYYREGGDDGAPPQALEIIKAIIENHLPVKLSSQPDYSDAIGPEGKPIT